MIAQNTIQEIVARIDAVDVIGSFVKLKKRGTNYLGLCPFHNERTPSFTVSPAKEIFKCFGCGKSGNSISFLMEHEKLSYVEALRWLAQKYNIAIEETYASPEVFIQQQTAESLHILNAFAQQFYQQQLFETEVGKAAGLTYLNERGFNEELIKAFGLGYAPDAKNALVTAAQKQQYNTDLLQKAGLATERNGSWIDVYRDRIVFPIHNNSGKIIGFGARLLKKNDKAPKYINTPENELYVKSKILYGLYQARTAVQKKDECLLVEGYTDVISLHGAGIENVVASGGTSLTTDQLRLIKKFTKNLTIIYDGDAAGIKAALRGLDMALDEGLNVKMVLIPDGEDPDSYVQKKGGAALQAFIAQHKKDFVLFQLEAGLAEAGGDGNKKTAVVNSIAETLARMSATEDFTKRQDYIKQTAALLKIDESGMTALVNKYIRDRIAKEEKKLPFEEARFLEAAAQPAREDNFNDQTFSLLFKDELQEKEIVRVLLEHGHKMLPEKGLAADYIIGELPEDDLFQSETVLHLLNAYKQARQTAVPEKTIFIYHPDAAISTLTVSILHSPYEQSYRWKKDRSQNTGYQKSLFHQDYKSFLHTISKNGEEELSSFLKTQKDTSAEEIESAINYLKLRKIKRLIEENLKELETATVQDQGLYFRTHQHLKGLEMELTAKLGTVIYQ